MTPVARFYSALLAWNLTAIDTRIVVPGKWCVRRDVDNAVAVFAYEGSRSLNDETRDMIGVFWPKPDARSVVQPEAAVLRLPGWHLEPSCLLPPDPLDTLDVHYPTGGVQHGRDPAVAVAAILGASSTMSAVSAASSVRPFGTLRCVDRCCPRTRPASLRDLDRKAGTGQYFQRSIRRICLRSIVCAAAFLGKKLLCDSRTSNDRPALI